MSVNERTAPVPGTETDDGQRLHELGYAQELRRRMSGFSNFAVSFTELAAIERELAG